MSLLTTKPLETIFAEAGENNTLRRALGPWNLISLGIGAIIGVGIFVMTGTAAAANAGPAIVLSFVLSAFGCVFAGLCYAEFASMIPVAGSAYTYGYATLGEIFAWIIGWDLILEYAFGAATVASGWSANFSGLMADLGINVPPQWIDTPGTELVKYQNHWTPLATLAGVDTSGLPHATAIFNFVAFFAILVVTFVLVMGIEESANLNTALVAVKVGTVLVFIGVAGMYLKAHTELARQNWHPFIPPNQGSFGSFGWSGVARGASVIFFAYIGFDAVSTAAQEAKNPQRDMPIGILGSLAICTVLYILVAGLLTALVPYRRLMVAAPVALAMDSTGLSWGGTLVRIGTIMGLSTTMLVMLLGQSRVFYSMSRDGLLPAWAGAIHPTRRTPWISSIVVGIVVAVFGATIPIGTLGFLVNIGTLLAFVIVSAGVWVLRWKRPDLPRPFRAPWMPLTPILSIVISLGLMAAVPWQTKMRLIIWLIVGLAIYFSYGRRHSKVSNRL
jgi:APA family basic amino acid/polyamine antiporter